MLGDLRCLCGCAGERRSPKVASEAVQVLAATGLAKGVLVERLFRDARAALIEDGMNEVMSLTAARKVVDRYPIDIAST